MGRKDLAKMVLRPSYRRHCSYHNMEFDGIYYVTPVGGRHRRCCRWRSQILHYYQMAQNAVFIWLVIYAVATRTSCMFYRLF